MPFILRAVSRVSGRFVRRGQDEEVSVGLLAFNEAIDAFDADKGAHFLSFAETVVRRRVIDYYRRQRSRQEAPMSAFDVEDEEGSVQNPVETRGALDRWSVDREAEERQMEIQAYAAELARYGLSFDDLVKASPKHADARRSAQEVAQIVARDPEMAAYLQQERRLPLRDLAGRTALSRKTLERQRRYIVAVAVIYLSECPHLRSYLA